MEPENVDIDGRLQALGRSPFRKAIRLNHKDRKYFNVRTSAEIREHAVRFVTDRLAEAQPRSDGKQTPWRGHPVFVAQHATATCCRGCIAKWHGIPVGQPLSPAEIQFLADLIMAWLTPQRTPGKALQQRTLFEETD